MNAKNGSSKVLFETVGFELNGTNTTISFSNMDTDDPVMVNETMQDIIQDPAVQGIFCVVYTTICLLGLFGNVLVCYVVGRNRAMHTVTNCFITNLALSDILLCVLAVPFTPLYTFASKSLLFIY